MLDALVQVELLCVTAFENIVVFGCLDVLMCVDVFGCMFMCVFLVVLFGLVALVVVFNHTLKCSIISILHYRIINNKKTTLHYTTSFDMLMNNIILYLSGLSSLIHVTDPVVYGFILFCQFLFKRFIFIGQLLYKFLFNLQIFKH